MVATAELDVVPSIPTFPGKGIVPKDQKEDTTDMAAKQKTFAAPIETPQQSPTNYALLVGLAAPFVGYATKGKIQLDNASIDTIVQWLQQGAFAFAMFRKNFSPPSAMSTAVPKK